MTTPAEKQNRAARRGCVWLLIGAPSLLLIYLFLLSTSLFDSRPGSYPDLEIPADEKTIPIPDALEASPDWAAWEASEESRSDLLNFINNHEADDPEWKESADKLRPELARAITLAEWLCGQQALLGPAPMNEDTSPLELSFEGLSELRGIIYTLRSVRLLAPDSQRERARLSHVSPLVMRLLAKTRPMGNYLIGRLTWLTLEAISHEFSVAELRQAVVDGNAERLRTHLALLEACRPPEDQALANAWKGEFHFSSKFVVHFRNQLGNLGWSASTFGASTSLTGNLLEQWTLLRLQPNRCAAILAEEARLRIRNANLPTRDRIWPVPAAMDWRNTISLAPNAGGEKLMEMVLTSIEKTFQTEDRGLARHHLLRLLIGLALYRIEHGNQLPADLGALVPMYLPEIPKDPYIGEPPLYDPSTGKLAFRGDDFVPSSAPVEPEAEERSRKRGLPPGVAGLFDKDGPHDPGVDLKAFFQEAAQPAP